MNVQEARFRNAAAEKTSEQFFLDRSSFQERAAAVAAGCVAFGMDRLAVAMFHTHGIDVATWPLAVREIVELR
jgi:hypothetical protein